METNIQANEPKRKKVNDFIKLFVGITALIFAMMMLKYAMGAFHLI